MPVLDDEVEPGADSTVSPLAGCTVVDFTQILAGPFCTQMMADAGARVIKVEPPQGEFSRIRGVFATLVDGSELTSYCASVNRGKRSIALDLKSAGGRQLALDLIAHADVVVENFAPGTLARLGIDFDALREQRPELITCSISLYGGTASAGPLARRGGLAIVAESEGGIAGLQRGADGAPVPLGFSLGDLGTAMSAFGAIMTAMYVRERTGSGRHLDISMVQTMLALNSVDITGTQLHPAQGSTPAVGPGYGMFRASDGWFAVAVNTDSLFARFARAIDAAWMAEPEHYAHHRVRSHAVEEVNAVLTAWCSTRTVDEVLTAISPSGVPCGRVATADTILASEDLLRLGFLRSVQDGGGGEFLSPNSPSGFRAPAAQAIPQVNEHATELLTEVLGMTEDAISTARAAGAFGTTDT